MNLKLSAVAVAAIVAMLPAHQAFAEAPAPYGTAKVDMHKMPVTNTVFDVNYDDPQKLNLLYNFLKNTKAVTKGKVVVVTHGLELRAFAKENYEKYQGIVDKMAELAKDGVGVNCITPAAAKTAIFDQMTEEHINYMLAKIPMGRFVQVDEIAAMACWLASEECSFTTSGVFDISGGRATY